jgi:hypothetical protein
VRRCCAWRLLFQVFPQPDGEVSAILVFYPEQVKLTITEARIRPGKPLARKMHKHSRPFAHTAESLGDTHLAEDFDLDLFGFGRRVG